jgi:hypothetical protein
MAEWLQTVFIGMPRNREQSCSRQTTCPGLRFACSQRPLLRAPGLTGRSSRRQYWPWLRHFHGQYWYPPPCRAPAPLTLGVRLFVSTCMKPTISSSASVSDRIENIATLLAMIGIYYLIHRYWKSKALERARAWCVEQGLILTNVKSAKFSMHRQRPRISIQALDAAQNKSWYRLEFSSGGFLGDPLGSNANVTLLQKALIHSKEYIHQ